MEKFAFKFPQRFHCKIKHRMNYDFFAGQQWVPGLKRLLEHTLKDKRVHNTMNMKKKMKRS